eukprot:763061-Hanusia_phi.AAC.4
MSLALAPSPRLMAFRCTRTVTSRKVTRVRASTSGMFRENSLLMSSRSAMMLSKFSSRVLPRTIN